MRNAPVERSDPARDQLYLFVPAYSQAVLEYFQQESAGVASLDELEQYVRDRDDVDPGDSEVAIRLHHSTLPKLADFGFVEYDAESTTVRLRSEHATSE